MTGIILWIHLRVNSGGHAIPWFPTRAKMALAMPRSWLVELFNGEDILASVNICFWPL